MNIMTKTS